MLFFIALDAAIASNPQQKRVENVLATFQYCAILFRAASHAYQSITV